MNLAQQLERNRAEALRLVPVSHETLKRLDQFVSLFLRWQPAVQLVAKSSLPQLWTRHIADSLQIVELAPEARLWVDLGSGGGFPGMIVALAIAEHPGARVHLIESDQRKASFLLEAARLTQAPVEVQAQRAEAAWPHIGPVDIVAARALAPLPRLLDLAAPFLAAKATGIFLKGQDVDNELTRAAKSWTIDWRAVPSKTDPNATVLIVKRAVRRALTPG
jgi:16S rRNA (guanine527-N7)-methyltransferase